MRKKTEGVRLKALKRFPFGSKRIEEETFVPVLIKRMHSISPLEGVRYIPVEKFNDKKRQRLRTFEMQTWSLGNAVPARVNMTEHYSDVDRNQIIVVPTSVTSKQVEEALEDAEHDAEVSALSRQGDVLDRQIERLEKQRRELYYKRIDILVKKAVKKLQV